MPINEYDDMLSTGKVANAGNEYMDLVSDQREEDKQGLKTAMFVAAKTMPDTSAKAQQIAAEMNLPAAIVERNLDSILKKRDEAAPDYDRLLDETPATAGWLKDPQNASISRDDLDNLAEHERQLKEFSFYQTMYRSLNVGLSNMYGSIARVPALAYDVAALPQNLLVKAIGRPDLQVRAPEWLMSGEGYDAAAKAYDVPELHESITKTIGNGEFSKAGRILASQFIANAPNQAALIAGAISGLEVPALIGAGVMQATNVMKDTREAGADPFASTIDAMTQGTIEAAFEKIGTFTLLKHWEGVIAKNFGKQTSREVMKDFAKTLFATAAGEGNEEFLTQLGQDFSDYATGINPNALKGTFQRAADAGILGATSGLAMTGPSAIGSGVVRSQQVMRAERAKSLYTALGSTAEASKVRARLPEAHRKFVENLVKDGPVENVYVDPKALTEYFQSKGIETTTMMKQAGALESYLEARETGTDVKIPLAGWTSAIVGTEYYQGLADDIKFSPDDLSVNQAKAVDEESRARVEQEASKPEEPGAQAGQKIADIVVEQLKEAGVDERTAATNAQLYEAAFKTLGKRTGVDPMTLFKEYGLKIVSEGKLAQTQGQTIMQGKPGEAQFIGWQEGIPADETGPAIPDEPLFNIPEGFPNAGSTVTIEKLKELGVPVPQYPTFDEWKANPKAFEQGPKQSTGAWLDFETGEMVSGEELARRKAERVFKAPVKETPEATETKAPAKKSSTTPRAGEVSDVGEQLWYNRRNFTKGLTWDKVKDLNPTLKTREVVKAKVWEKPDYEELVDGGMQPFTAHLIKQIYDAIAAKPAVRGEVSDEMMKRYMDGVAKVRDVVFAWAKDTKAQADFVENLTKNRGSFISELGARQAMLLDQVFFSDASQGKRFRDNPEANSLAILLGGNKLVKSLQPGHTEMRSAMKAIEEGFPAKRELWQVQFKIAEEKRGTNPSEFYVVRKATGRIMGTGFKTKDSAATFAKTLVEKKSPGQQPEREILERWERVGPPRRETGQDVKPQALIDVFGFRGINFGNWVKDAERQEFTNAAYDALHDLAEVLKIPPKAISLNGLLGLAFGAQGRGGRAAAHFVPGVNEINLTKTAGAGALAHEWGHALDHYFGVKAGLAKKERPYLTHHVEGTKETMGDVRPEITKAFNDIVSAMKYRLETPEETEERIKKNDKRDMDRLESWLRAIQDRLKTAITDTEKQSAALKKFEKLADRVRKGDVGDGYIQSGRSQWSGIKPVVAEIRDLFRSETGRPLESDYVKGLNSNAEYVARTLKEESRARVREPIRQSTKLASESMKTDREKGGKEYWNSETELLARSFESYVLDQLSNEARRNDYLTAPQSKENFLYPQGVEREKINSAFDTLVGSLKTRETKQGVELFQAAYHGSPHTFERFSLQKIGTGEGEQAYGWGMYFAGKKAVAEFYRNALAKSKGQDGRLYKVDIPEDEHFIAWDKILVDQPKALKKFLGKERGGNVTVEIQSPDGSTHKGAWDLYETTGEQFYYDLSEMLGSEEAASRFLAGKGVAGIKFLDQQSRMETGEQTFNFVVFDDNLIKIVEFEQRKKDQVRGRMVFGDDRQFNIELMKSADRSTFLHETGHFYLEVLGDLAAKADVPADVKADYDTILKWLGAESREKITREMHEKWARGFEAYLMEGKAPSSALRTAFARFRAWLIAVYQRVQNLKVELSPEVRGVMDRLLASQEEIDAALQEQAVSPLFPDPKAVGMTDAEADQYAKALNEAKMSAEEQVTSKVMAEIDREQKKWWKEQRDAIKEKVSATVNAKPEYIALSVLQHGTMPDGTPLPAGMEAIKLSRKAIETDFQTFDIKNLPKPYVYAKEGGVHPDVAAGLFGFQSGHQLLFAIETAEKRERLINRLTDEQMKAEHGDMMTDGRLHEEAVKAVHNDMRSKLLHVELQHLASNNLPALKSIIRRVSKPLATVETIRSQAENIIAQKKVREISPSLYQRAEARASREAVDAMLKGDLEAAFNAKQRELLNHELYRAAVAAREDVDKIVAYMKKFDKATTRERLGKAGGEYLAQIDAIAERFDFRQATLKAIEKRKSLVAWVQEQTKAGFSVDVPEELLNEAYRQHYKETPYRQLSEIRDTVEEIAHLARLKNELLANERLRNLEAARDEIVASITAHHDTTPEPLDFAPGIKKRLIEGAQKVLAAHTRMEFLFEFLDGNKPHGPVWDILFKPFVAAESKENEMMHDVVENVNRIFSVYPKKERAFWFFKREFIPEINTSMTKANMLAVALNWGNEYNREALKEGYGWTDEQVQAILDKLDKRDWDTVQAAWDYIDSFWPQVAELEKTLNGLPPGKVEAIPVETRFGQLKGGYYPIVFDSKLSWRQSVLEEKANVNEMFGGNWARAMTRHGHTIERTNTGGKPIRLELTGLTEHLSNVVHDLAFRKPVIDASRIISNNEVRLAIEGAAGREMYRQLNPWLAAIAGDRRGEAVNPIEGILGRARSGATVVSLGLKMTSAMVQVLGYTLTAKEVGPKYAAMGLRDAFRNPREIAKTWDFILERSKMMRDRRLNYDRDVRDAMKKMNVAGVKPGIGSVVDAYTMEMREAFFFMVGYMDLGTAMPTWLAAYRKAMDGQVENIKKGDEKDASEYADMVVRQTQSAGAAKDLAAIQRGSEAFKLFTMFYSQLSLMFNQFQKVGNQFRIDKDFSKMMGALGLIWFLPAVLEDVLRGRAPGGDDEPEDVARWFAKKELLYPFASIVLLRDISNAMDSRDYSMSPVADAFQSLTKTAKAVVERTVGEKDEFTKTDLKNAVMTVGYFAALPTRQVWQTLEYFHDWMTGEQQPSNVVEGLWRALIVGKKRE